MTIKLKPCPFCGERGQLTMEFNDYYAPAIFCKSCGAYGPSGPEETTYGDDAAFAVAAPLWNRRASIIGRFLGWLYK